MAKKASAGGVNKSQSIRDALAKNPDASPKELSAELSAAGIDVSPAFVSMTKFNMKAKKKGPKKTKPTREVSGNVVADDLIEVKKLVDRVGGIENAQSLLGTLKRLL